MYSMKRFFLVVVVFVAFLGTAVGFGLPSPLFFTPDIEVDNILYQYTAPQPSICFHPDDVSIRILMYHYIREADRDPAGSIIANNSISSQEFASHARVFSNYQKQGKAHLMLFSELKQAYET